MSPDRAAVKTTGPDPDVYALLGEPEAEFDYLVPELLERRDRMMLTGTEGTGKSELLRQFSVLSASGLHPFSLEPIDAIRVLMIDFENSRRHVKRKLYPLVVKGQPQEGNLIVLIRSEGIDLGRPEDVEWLTERVAVNQPDLMCLGPLYKMSRGDPSSEEDAQAVSSSLDQIRADHDVAILLEAHSPHAANGGPRPIRPIGSSLWLRWPEFGLHLAENGQLKPWRGSRDERAFPVMLRRDGEWPWTPAPDEELGARIEAALRKHLGAGEDPGARACRKAVRDAGVKARNDVIDAARVALQGGLL
jgi:hypothetical protein